MEEQAASFMRNHFKALVSNEKVKIKKHALIPLISDKAKMKFFSPQAQARDHDADLTHDSSALSSAKARIPRNKPSASS